MPSTNGHGPKRAILYARVSTDEQARSGYSLAQQLEALRDYAAREGYEVDPEQMAVVRRIFDMVGAEGKTLHAARKILDREGVPTPGRARYWSTYFTRSVIRDDVYRPHTYAEVRELVAPDVALRLDLAKRYGIWYYNVTSRKRRQVAEVGPTGAGSTPGAHRSA
jgi:hypothetical protein